MRHGFKAKAERISTAARERLGIGPLDPMPARAFVESQGILLLDLRSLPLSAKTLKQLLVVDSGGWSGMTIKVGGVTAVIVNPSHSSERQTSTLMHEAAHTILGHLPVRVDISEAGILLVSEFSEDDEAEADWLAGALLLPREALKAHRSRGRTSQQIAQYFGVSLQMSEYRLRMTAVDVQIGRSRAATH